MLLEAVLSQAEVAIRVNRIIASSFDEIPHHRARSRYFLLARHQSRRRIGQRLADLQRPSDQDQVSMRIAKL
jgi:hypothetical protein